MNNINVNTARRRPKRVRIFKNAHDKLRERARREARLPQAKGQKAITIRPQPRTNRKDPIDTV
jgi:hypothetical protein